MKCERFDEVIDLAFRGYPQIGPILQLLSTKEKPSIYTITLLVTGNPLVWPPTVDIWHFDDSQFINREKGPIPIGIRTIEKDKLVGCCEAAKSLPPGFPLDEASCELYWPLYPRINEPAYVFYYKDTSISIGGYTGKTME